MAGEKEAPKSNVTQQHAEQPQLVMPDGGQFQWPEATAQQPISIFLAEVGEKNVLKGKEELRLKQQREAQQKLRQKRREANPEGFKAAEAQKMRWYREIGSTNPPPEYTGRKRRSPEPPRDGL